MKQRVNDVENEACKRIRSEEVLLAWEERYRNLVETSFDAIFSLSVEDGSISDLNPAFEEITGWPRRDWIGRPFASIIHPDDVPIALTKFQQVLRGEATPRFELRVRTRSGEDLVGEFIATPEIKGGKVVGVIGFARDITKRKRAEDALRASEKKYHDIFENVSDWLFLHDLEGVFLDYNSNAMAQIGYTKGDLGHINVRDIIPTRFKHQFEDYLKRIKENGKDEGLMAVMTRDGRKLIVEYRNSVVYGPSGIHAIQGSARDITERIQAEKALKKSEEKYRTILESIEDGYYEMDISGNLKFFNDSMCRIVGYSRDELLGMNNRQYMDKETAEKVYQAFSRVYNTGKPEKGFEYEIIRKDGTKRNIEVSVSLMKDPADHRIGFRGIVRDITERRRAEMALKESEEKYRTILEKIQDSYFEVDIAGNLSFFNNSLPKALGYSPDMLMGTNYRRYMSQDTAGKVRQLFNEVYTLRRPVEGFDFEVIRRDGTIIHVDTTVSLIRNAEGQPVGFRCISRDITERKRAEEELRRAHEELEKRVEERTLELAKINEELEAKSNKLEEVNIALRILLKKRAEDKTELEKNMLFNVRELVLPYLDKLNKSGLLDKQRAYLDIINSNLNDIVSPFLYVLSSKFLILTPTEIQIANFIKHGKSTKEIAEVLNLSNKTVETHRKNIRKKIGIKNIKGNLRTHLLSVQ
jgi:PAS domain S-box-containing protein